MKNNNLIAPCTCKNSGRTFRKYSFFLLTLLIIGFQKDLYSLKNFVGILPVPQEISFTKECFLLRGAVISFDYTLDDAALNNVVKKLKSLLLSVNAGLAETVNKGNKKIFLSLTNPNSKNNGSIKENKIGEEGYFLSISSGIISINANTPKGLFYGVTTLMQILRNSSGFLPGLRITDFPLIPKRIVMDDISRGPVPTIEFMKKQIERLSELKINGIMYYVEHVIKTKSHPEFAPLEGALSIDDFTAVAGFAKLHNIELIASFQSFGHFENILKSEKYARLGESSTLISPVKNESYKFLEDIYSEMIPAFNSEYFNVNCDETFDLGKNESKKIVDSLGYAEVYFNHVMKLYDILKNHNTKMMIWGDVVLEHSELLRKLPTDIVICPWNYDAKDSFEDLIQPVKNAGFKCFVTTGILNSSKLIPELNQTFGNIKNFTADAVKFKADGIITSVWDDGGTAFFSNDWYGLAYGAENCWNNKNNDLNDFDKRFNACLYGAVNSNYSKALRTLNKLADLEPTDAMTDKILYDKIVPDSSGQLSLSVIDLDQVIKLSSETIDLLDNTGTSRYSEDIEYTKFIARLYNTLATEKINLLEAAGKYSTAESTRFTNKVASRDLVVNAIVLVNSVINSEIEIKNSYEKFWLMENHIYALNRITDKFQNKINSLNSVKGGLLNSLKQFDSGNDLLPANSIRLSLTKLPGKYFREWLVIDPVPVNSIIVPDTVDYLYSMGGIQNAAPEVTQEFVIDSRKFRWKRFVSELPDKILLGKDSGNSVIYAYASITSEEACPIKALFGSGTNIEVYLNGKMASGKTSEGIFTPDKYNCPLNLVKGKNRLMIKLTGKQSDLGFSFRLPDDQVRNRKNRYKIIK